LLFCFHDIIEATFKQDKLTSNASSIEEEFVISLGAFKFLFEKEQTETSGSSPDALEAWILNVNQYGENRKRGIRCLNRNTECRGQ
jgi:hypothetical protein